MASDERPADGEPKPAAPDAETAKPSEPAREGDVLVLKSGLKSVGQKTYIWCHWLFDAESGACFATAEAVAVAMDLATRKAIEIPPDMRKMLEALVIPDLGV